MRGMALLALAALASGCFAYDPGAKKWAYTGDAILIVGGGAAIAGDVLTHEHCEGLGCPKFDPPFTGAAVAGAILVTAGLLGLIFTATREPVKTSR